MGLFNFVFRMWQIKKLPNKFLIIHISSSSHDCEFNIDLDNAIPLHLLMNVNIGGLTTCFRFVAIASVKWFCQKRILHY